MEACTGWYGNYGRKYRRMRWLTSITDMNMSKLQEMVKEREAWCAAIHGVARVRHDLATEQCNRCRDVFCFYFFTYLGPTTQHAGS